MPLHRRDFLKAASGGGALAALTACGTTNLATGRQSFTGFYDIEDDIAIGRREHPRMLEAFGGEYGDPRLERYVTDTGAKLARHADYQQFPYRFSLLNSPIVNAFALPGGPVYLTRGLLALAGSEAEMAGVLAHELGHVNARHGAERMAAQQIAALGAVAGAIGAEALGLPAGTADLAQSIAGLAVRSYSRKQEFEADTLGVRYMSRAGYEPEAMVTFLSTLREQSRLEARSLGLSPGEVDQYNMMSTHPRTIDRVRQAQAESRAERPANPAIGREEHLAQIDGMLFGDDPGQGITFGRRFVHPGLGFEFTVPAGFRIRNEPDAVLAHDGSGAAVIFDSAPMRSRGMAEYVRYEWAPKAALHNVEAFRVNGAEAAAGYATSRGRDGPSDVSLVALRRDRSSAYRFVFVSPRHRTAALSGEFRSTMESLRVLSASEAAAIRPLRLRVVPAQSGDTAEALSRNLPYGSLNPDWFRVLNDLEPGGQPQPGTPLKVVKS